MLVPLYLIWYLATPEPPVSVELSDIVTSWFVQLPLLELVIVGAVGAVVSIFFTVAVVELDIFPTASLAHI